MCNVVLHTGSNVFALYCLQQSVVSSQEAVLEASWPADPQESPFITAGKRI